jgi:hypothetical protein
MLVLWSFLYFLVTIPVILVLGVIHRFNRSVRVRRAGEILVVTGGVGLLPSLVVQASTDPVMWLGVVGILVIVFGGVIVIVRRWNCVSANF